MPTATNAMPTHIRGSVFTPRLKYAAIAFTVTALLAGACVAPVVILRLRGRQSLGATFITVVSDYADRLAAVGGRLVLSGVSTPLHNRIERADGQDLGDALEIFDATSVLGESTFEANAAAEHWLDDTVRERSRRREDQD